MRSAPALLRLHFRRLGIAQQDLAKRLGMTPAAVSHALNGKHAPRPEHAERWAKALGLGKEDAEELIDAIHLAASTPRVRAMVRRLVRDRKS